MTIEERVQQLIEDGAVIQVLIRPPGLQIQLHEFGLAAVAYHTRPARLRWCSIFPEHQSHVHETRFDEKVFDNDGRDVLFNLDGQLMAAVVPYNEAGLDSDEVRQGIAEWRDRLAVPGNQEQFDEFFEEA